MTTDNVEFSTGQRFQFQYQEFNIFQKAVPSLKARNHIEDMTNVFSDHGAILYVARRFSTGHIAVLILVRK